MRARARAMRTEKGIAKRKSEAKENVKSVRARARVSNAPAKVSRDRGLAEDRFEWLLPRYGRRIEVTKGHVPIV